MAVAKAKDFLESNTYSADDPYTTALSAYALALLRSPYAPLALRRLNHMAITQGTTTRHCEQHDCYSPLVSFGEISATWITDVQISDEQTQMLYL